MNSNAFTTLSLPAVRAVITFLSLREGGAPVDYLKIKGHAEEDFCAVLITSNGDNFFTTGNINEFDEVISEPVLFEINDGKIKSLNSDVDFVSYFGKSNRESEIGSFYNI